MRTTIDLDVPILRELKRLQKIEGKSLGRLVSDLLALALADRNGRGGSRATFQWISRPMGARIDIRDRQALYAALETEVEPGEPDSARPHDR